MKAMNSFATHEEKKFLQAFPDAQADAESLKRYYELRKLELEGKKDRAGLRDLDDFYTNAMSEIAGGILESDYKYSAANSKSVALTPEMRNNIKTYRNQLLREGLIKVEKSKPFCVVCGKRACSGDLFVLIRKDNTAACLDCCTPDVKLDKVTDLVFID